MREIRTAELLSIGSELTVGETRDTNAGELAAALTEAGVEVIRITALPDDLPIVQAAFEAALGRADLVVSTGGLGPTPDDLTRESIAAAIGETPAVDPGLEARLRGRFDARGLAFSTSNLKQAWLIESATSIPNDNGTAPGWWVDRPDERLIVALPGPPRELRPMWAGWVLPRLRARGFGQRTASVTLRTVGLGESQMAERLGARLDRGANPTIATYARADAVDVRISAFPADGQDAEAMVAAAESEVMGIIGEYVWGRGAVSWADAIEAALATRNWRLATVEIGTRGSVAALLGEGVGDRLISASILTTGTRNLDGDGPLADAAATDAAAQGDAPRADAAEGELAALARATAERTGADIVMVVRARRRGDDLSVSIAITSPDGEHAERRVTFLAGALGRSRAALVAAAVLQARVR